MSYRVVTTSVSGFVQQIACCYLRHGYWFYVTGHVPEHKDPHSVDRKLIEKYGINVSQSTRSRRKRLGQANLQYLRYDRFFAILATKGEHRFFVDEAKTIHDIRRVPLKFNGYTIGYRRGGRTRDGNYDSKWHAHVAIERSRYLEIRDHFVYLATRRSAENLALEFYRIPFEPYAPVRRQLLNILRAVNRARKKARYSSIPYEVIPMRRRIVMPFEEISFSSNGKTSRD